MKLTHSIERSITAFRGENAFLSNFYESPIELAAWTHQRSTALIVSRWDFMKIEAPTVEHGYQAYKARYPDDLLRILAAKTPGEAKKAGRAVPIRSGWDEIKEAVMLRLLRAKFKQNEWLMHKLLATSNRILIEGNGWGDRYWGVCNGNGQNRLGVLLMQVREEIRP